MRKLFLFLSFVVLAGCADSRFLHTAEFAVWVDSISVPQEISSSDPLTVRFHGMIGPNQCYSFDRFLTNKEPDRLDVAAFGRYEASGRCEPIEVFLSGRELVVSPPFVDPFTIMVYQPTGDSLRYELRVR